MTTPVSTTTISLNDVADRDLNHYQKLFDISMFSLSSFRKASEQDYDEFAQQLVVMPKNNVRMSFDKAKDATETWVLKHVLSEALGSIVPLMEDCRTICALCDYKAGKKTNASELQLITGKQRQDFLILPIAEKFALLTQKYGLQSEVQEHVQSLLEATRALVKEGVLTEAETNGQPSLTLKIRSVMLVQTPAKSATGGEAGVNLTRKINDNSRVVKVGEKITFTKAEQFGSLLTLSIFLGSMLQGVQNYAKKTGVAS
ncbi:MAG TPA: hypothetical protein VGC39_07455 [Candidatus Methylacidiphilales bacterium]